MKIQTFAGILILTLSLASAHASEKRTHYVPVVAETPRVYASPFDRLSNESTPSLPGQVVRALPGQIIRPLPGQVVQSLPGQLVGSLPYQLVPRRGLPRHYVYGY